MYSSTSAALLRTSGTTVASVIIDPLYTLPLLVGVLVAAFRRKVGGTALRVGLMVSTLYVGWSWVAQTWDRIWREPLDDGALVFD